MPPYAAAAPGGFYPGLYPGLGGQQGAYQFQQQPAASGAQTAAPQVGGEANQHNGHHKVRSENTRSQHKARATRHPKCNFTDRDF